jgi:hypothetical protein
MGIKCRKKHVFPQIQTYYHLDKKKRTGNFSLALFLLETKLILQLKALNNGNSAWIVPI